MKHNEFKAYFKKKLENILTDDYDLISIDETNSYRNLYIIEKETFETKYFIKSFWNTEYFHIQLFEINSDVRQNKTKLSILKGYILDIEGNYFQTHLFNELFKQFQEVMVENF